MFSGSFSLSARVFGVAGVILLSACTRDAAQNTAAISRALFGYIPPPEQTSVLQELTSEYDRCIAANPAASDCAQRAYDTVRLVKGLDRKPLPTGIVIVREDNSTEIKEQK